MKSFILSVCCMFLAWPCAADLFTARDGSLSIDMPAGWTRAGNIPPRSVLSAEKGNSRLDIKTIDCTTESCLDKMINNDVSEVKARQMSVVKNTYTDEEIKRVELSNGEPFYYISFYSPKNDFSAGYFLINGKGYSILAKNVTYAETDLLFSAISPHVPLPQPEESAPVDIMDVYKAYDTQAIEEVDVENLKETEEANPTETLPFPVESDSASPRWSKLHRAWQTHWRRLNAKTLVTPSMSPFIRELGHGYDVIVILLALFLFSWAVAGIIRIFTPAKRFELPANPNSLYPIRLERLYGTPSLIFRARDNQGNILTALSTRWDALIMFTGIVLILLALSVMAATSLCEQLHVTALANFYSIIYAVSSLALPLGLVIFFCGIVWEQISLSEMTLYDNKGRKAAVILQKGYSLAYERYQIYFARSKELMLAERKRFALRRTWKLMSKDRIEFACITERSAKRAIVRMLCGHLWGMMRADYDITGAMESRGVLENKHALFNQSICNIDKPEAVAARDLLALSLLISIRDRDKWYPWFN